MNPKIEEVTTKAERDELRMRLEVALLRKQAQVTIGFNELDDSIEMDKVNARAKGISDAIEVVREFFHELR